MSNYNISQIPKTVSTLIMSGIIASTYTTYNPTIQKGNSEPQFAPYRTDTISKTTSYHHAGVVHPIQQKEFQFETTLTNFITQLSSQQEDLEEDFQNVLIDNLWDLYQA